MRTVLVPVDFSDASLNAAAYAVKMFTGIYGVNMLLYHVYEKPEHGATAAQELKKMKSALFDMGIVKMDLLCEESHDFVSCLEKFIRENKPDEIIMGINTGRNKIEQTFTGRNILHLTQKNFCPVLIVPAGAEFHKLKNIALASDFTDAPSSVVAGFIKHILSDHFAKLHIVNVNPDFYVSITEAGQKVIDDINELFKGYEHEFHFIGLYDFPETMNMFANDHDMDMIITMPKDHAWSGTLPGSSNTKRLAYTSHVPVLALH